MQSREPESSWSLNSIYKSLTNLIYTESETFNNVNIDEPSQLLNNANDVMKGRVLLNDIYFIKISPDADDFYTEEITSRENSVIKMRLSDVTKLLNALDKDKMSRSSSDAVNYFTSGNFISARADVHAQAHHNLYVRCLKRPEFYIQSIVEILHDAITSNKHTNLKDFISMPLRDVLAKGLFELENIPPELNAAISAFSSITETAAEDFATNVKLATTVSMLPNWSLGAFGFSEVKELYLTTSKEFLANQKTAIFDSIQAFANDRACQNLIALSIIHYPVN